MTLRDSLRGRMELLRSDSPHYSARTGLIALVLLLAITHHVPLLGKSGQIVRAEFAAANQVNKLTPVRVAGVDVGKVESVERGSSPDTAIVKMRITDDQVQLHRDARAAVRWRTVLGGNMFIDVQPGSPSAPALGDAVIPASRTTSQAELDDVTQIFDHGTANAQRAMLRGLRSSLADPSLTGRAIQTLGPTMRTVGEGLLRAFAGQQADLGVDVPTGAVPSVFWIAQRLSFRTERTAVTAVASMASAPRAIRAQASGAFLDGAVGSGGRL